MLAPGDIWVTLLLTFPERLSRRLDRVTRTPKITVDELKSVVINYALLSSAESKPVGSPNELEGFDENLCTFAVGGVREAHIYSQKISTTAGVHSFTIPDLKTHCDIASSKQPSTPLGTWKPAVRCRERYAGAIRYTVSDRAGQWYPPGATKRTGKGMVMVGVPANTPEGNHGCRKGSEKEYKRCFAERQYPEFLKFNIPSPCTYGVGFEDQHHDI
jgi:hypothetical protein